MTSGNPVLDKNLEAIARYNPELSDKILNLAGLNNVIDLIETNQGEPNLTFNAIPLHSQEGAENEAKIAFSQVQNTPRSKHVVFGIGIGHLFKEFCENSKGAVFLFEQNLEILRVTLELVDFSKELSQENVFVTSTMDFFKTLYVTNVQYKSNFTMVALNSYKNFLYHREFADIKRQIEIIVGSTYMDYNVLKEEEVTSSMMVIANLAETVKGVPLAEIKDVYKDKTALIISAGPTLDLNIETIKKNRDKVVIFCVGQAYKALISNDIKPDFVNVIEPRDFSGQLKGFDLSDVNLIIEPYTHNAFYKLEVKKRFLFPSKDRNANQFWAKLTDTDISPYLIKGTVSYGAMASAKMLGCSKIVLVGQDLAYINNQCYASKSAYGGLMYEKDSKSGEINFKIENQEESISSYQSTVDGNSADANAQKRAENKVKGTKTGLFYVKGISGEMLPTLAGYAVFVENFRDFAVENNHLKLINTSLVGAQIDGFENLPLEKALEDSPVIGTRDFKCDFRFDRTKIINNIIDENLYLRVNLSKIKEAYETIFEYEKILKKNKSITKESVRCVQQLLNVYEKLEKKADGLYNALSFKEDIEISYIIDENETFDTNVVKDLFGLLKVYFTNVEQKIITAINALEEQKGEI